MSPAVFCSSGYPRCSRDGRRSLVNTRFFVALSGWLLVSSAAPVPAVLLWSFPGATRVHETGPGTDILGGALKRDELSSDSLYFKFHVAPLSDQTTEEYF